MLDLILPTLPITFNTSAMASSDPITVLIFAWNRPIFLWACLDSLYRYTKVPARYVMIENGSSDPLVRPVIEGFRQRGMFHEIEWGEENSITRLFDSIRRLQPTFGEYFVYIEGDTTVAETQPCWLERMRSIMDADPELMMLGSYVDKRDFVDPEHARRLEPNMSESQLAGLVKAHSPERHLPPQETAPVIDPFNPPGRLLMFRTSILDRIRLSVDGELYQQIKALGLKAGIATGVVHRHLSLLNFFDYPDYSMQQRDDFMTRVAVVEHNGRAG